VFPRIALLVSVFGLLAAAPAADVSGKWSGDISIKNPDGGTDSGQADFEFQQRGQEVTGTATSDESGVVAIRNGKFRDGRLVFEVVAQQPAGEERVYKMELKLIREDRLEGTLDFKLPDGTAITGRLVLTRAKT
jgi:hypothetical protein